MIINEHKVYTLCVILLAKLNLSMSLRMTKQRILLYYLEEYSASTRSEMEKLKYITIALKNTLTESLTKLLRVDFIEMNEVKKVKNSAKEKAVIQEKIIECFWIKE